MKASALDFREGLLVAILVAAAGCTLPQSPSATLSAAPVPDPLPESGTCPKISPRGQPVPAFPRRALGQHGWAIVEFDVTSDGVTSNVHIYESSPLELFDRESVIAVQKWKLPSSFGAHRKCRTLFVFSTYGQ